MKVVLLAKVKGLGDPDDIKEVAEGYANNFLFPRHLAVLASEKTLQQLKTTQKKKVANVEKELKTIQNLIEKIDSQMIVVRGEPNEAGVLYAAIGPQKIIEAMESYGYSGIAKNQIIAPVIKELGEYTAKIKFKHGLEAKINLSVRPPKTTNK